MAFCLRMVPKTSQNDIDEFLLHLRRFHLVNLEGGTPTALLMKGVTFYSIETDWDVDEYGRLWVTREHYIHHRDRGHHFRKYLKYLQDPCDNCQHGRPCKRNGDCTTVHGFCLDTDIRLPGDVAFQGVFDVRQWPRGPVVWPQRDQFT